MQFSRIRAHFLVAIATVTVVCGLAASSASANVWGVPDSESIGAMAVDLNPQHPGLVAIRGNKVVRIPFSGENAGKQILIAGDKAKGWADGASSQARFSYPDGIAIDQRGTIFVADTQNHCIRRIDPATGLVTTLAGGSQGFSDGIGDSSKFNRPRGIAVDGDSLIVADVANHRIRELNLKTREVSTLAGGESGFADGVGLAARFLFPNAVAIDRDRNVLINDILNYKIRKLDRRNGAVTTVAGSKSRISDGDLAVAAFAYPTGIVIGPDGEIVVSDAPAQRIRKIDLKTNQVTTVSGDGHVALERGAVVVQPDGPKETSRYIDPTVVAAWPTGGVFVAQPLGGTRFIAPDDELEEKLVEYRRNPTTELKALILKEYGNPTVALDNALLDIKETVQSQKQNRLGHLPKELQVQLTMIQAAKSINQLRLMMAGVISEPQSPQPQTEPTPPRAARTDPAYRSPNTRGFG